MPFANSCIADENGYRADARERFRSLAGVVVKRPLSTFLLQTVTEEGKMRFLIVDRSVSPVEGGVVLYATPHGIREVRFDESHSIKQVWGSVVWFLEQG